MSDNCFIGSTSAPTGEELANALGGSLELWEEILAHVEDEYPPIEQVWKCPAKKYGWSLRAIRKKRTILYLVALEGHFRVAFVLGDRAVQASKGARLPKKVVTDIEEARRYAEGTGFSLLVRSKRDIPAIRKLIRIKIEN